MGSRLKAENYEILSNSSSIRQKLLRKLRSSKFSSPKPPFPFCENNCPWWILCMKIKASECVELYLREVTINNQEREQEQDFIGISWE